MTSKKSEKNKVTAKAKVHKELKGLDVSINQFGELKSNMSIEKINAFLNRNVEDKKLVAQQKKAMTKK